MKPTTSMLGRVRPESLLSGMAEGWPLTGRVEELGRVGGLVRRRDGPAGVVLAGVAGVGKTRLAREALAAAEQRGAVTRWAVATASARVLPLGAVAAMLGVWSALFFPDSCLIAILCRGLPVQVLVVDLLRGLVPEC